ncbi:MAG: polyprenyl synthetase family protein [Thermoplasmatota archaeon]
MDPESILKQRAKIFDNALNGNLSHHQPKIVYDAIRWIPMSGGKRLRPILAMLCCEAVGGRPEKTIPFGTALEYIHNATLIHDDIIDKDLWRRGLQTTHEKYGIPMAIIAGDGLIGETYRMLSYMAPPELKTVTYKHIIRGIADAAKRFYEGQAMDIEFEKRFDVSIPEYMTMIEKKTGQLYWLAGRGGALIGKGSQNQVDNLARYGLLFGIMFQIKDDLLNILTDQAPLGKQQIGSDIINGKRTLILVHALLHATPKDKKTILSVLGNKKSTTRDIQKIITIFHTTKSIEFAQNKLIDYSKKAQECLQTIKESEAKQILQWLIDYSVNRTY